MAAIIVMCRRRAGGCPAPSWLEWLLHWPGLLALGAGVLVFLAASWYWVYRWLRFPRLLCLG